MKKIHYLKHEEFEDLGCIRDWANKFNVSISFTRLYLNESLPKDISFDLLIVLGGSMNVYEEAKYPWLISEKIFIKKVIDAGISVLGICLGAQLLSVVLGGSVRKNKYKEIGWYPVRLVDNEEPVIIDIEDKVNVFHWHGDIFSIPNGAKILYTNQACENQGFIFNSKVIGLQFHLEMDISSVNLICEACSNELVQGEFIQNINTIRELTIKYTQSSNLVMNKILDFLLFN